MDSEILQSLGWFAQHFVTALAATLAFGLVYALATPHKELELIRAGNTSAAVGFFGVIIGYAIQINLVFSVTPDILEALVWGAVALAVQLVAHVASRIVMPNLSADIAEGKLSAGVVQAGIGIVVGLLGAAALTP
jgi:putative membrane protein